MHKTLKIVFTLKSNLAIAIYLKLINHYETTIRELAIYIANYVAILNFLTM